jgi:hypothetical protein
MKINRYVLQPDGDLITEEAIIADELSFTAKVTLEAGAKVIGTGITGKGPVLWAMYAPGEVELVERHFFVCGNRVDLPESVGQEQYVGTAKIVGGPTFHVFELSPVAV